MNEMVNGDGGLVGMQVLTASVPKEVSHLTTLMNMGRGGSAADAHGHELRAACS